MRVFCFLIVAIVLLTLPACDSQPSVNKPDGIKDALDARPNEKLRDAAEDAGDAIKEAGHDIKDAVKGS